jgi:hypothetical protein
MPCQQCGGEWDIFFQDYLHKRGCPKRQVGHANQQQAKERMEQGRKDAFGMQSGELFGDASYKLGRKQEEERRTDHIVHEVWGLPRPFRK